MLRALPLATLLLASSALSVQAATAPVAPAFAPASTETAPVLTTSQEWRRMAEAGAAYPLFAVERERVEALVRAAMAQGVNVPTPRDPGGGFTHEQHKRNYQAIYNAGALYRLTGDKAYADYARDLLLEYAKLYPTLGQHPAGRGQIPGRLFWQTLNDSVWLVYSIQGYDAIRETLTAEERRRIDDDVFRRMARFLSAETPENSSASTTTPPGPSPASA